LAAVEKKKNEQRGVGTTQWRCQRNDVKEGEKWKMSGVLLKG